MSPLNAVTRTRSGLFVRTDADLGLLVYSPYTGLTFAVHHRDADVASAWLDGSGSAPVDDSTRRSLGPGWAIPSSEGRYGDTHLLPTSTAWMQGDCILLVYEAK